MFGISKRKEVFSFSGLKSDGKYENWNALTTFGILERNTIQPNQPFLHFIKIHIFKESEDWDARMLHTNKYVHTLSGP